VQNTSTAVSRRAFLKTSATLLAGTSVGLLRAKPTKGQGKIFAYVGTFSSPLHDVLPTQVDLPPGNGRGIHIFQMDADTGALTPVDIYEHGTSPSCVALDHSATHLYSSNETDRVGEKKEGTISSFIIKPDGRLQLLNTVPSGAPGPTFVSLHPSGKFLFVANYFGGSVAVFPILSDGSLANATDLKIDSGKIGPTHATHAPPGSFAISGHDRTHAHMIQTDPAGRFVFHADNALDKIFVWKFDDAKGALIANDPSAVTFPAGDGPRHFCFHPTSPWFYSIQEEASTVALFDYDSQAGRLNLRQSISALPPGFTGSNFCSEIMVSRDGRFLYAGNRLHDSIAVFGIRANGELKYVGEEWTRGDYPRSFNVDPRGQFLYCCNQRADNVTVFRVDKRTGRLKFTDNYVPVGNPSMIVFAERAE
jgi:6-phosphogluconolactonase (cycloisomerase 2 family)